MNKHTKQVLQTWYPKDHPLHYELHHPLGKLVGEWGELLDDYMKHLYKPDYDWEPLEELVDIWYYIEILSYQTKINLEIMSISWLNGQIDYLISEAMCKANYNFRMLVKAGREATQGLDLDYSLRHNYSALSELCELSNLTIDQLAEASWNKLKPGSERGEEWMKAGLNRYLEARND